MNVCYFNYASLLNYHVKSFIMNKELKHTQTFLSYAKPVFSLCFCQLQKKQHLKFGFEYCKRYLIIHVYVYGREKELKM